MIRIHILSDEERGKLNNLDEIRKAEIEKLKKLITKTNKNWLPNAEKKTKKFQGLGKYEEETKEQSWGKIKTVYMKLQSFKCAYCEQVKEDKPIDHHVEHFRPKKNVKVWLNEERKTSLNLNFKDEEGNGYHLLPYNIFNYVTSCGHCNSSLKSDFFPIAGVRKLDTDDFQLLNGTEKPFLLYPLGHLDDDTPEDLISFQGTSPIIHPDITDEHKKLRAFITIKFFNLDILREMLILQRSDLIKKIYEAVWILNETTNNAMKAQKEKDILRYIDAKSEHSNCAKSFFKLCMNDLETAKKHWEAANQYFEQYKHLLDSNNQ